MKNRKMLIAMDQEAMVCIWPNDVTCPMDKKDEFVAIHGDNFLFAILLDEEDVVDLSASIVQFWEDQKSLAIH